jgi:LacI family transcriptional regulator
MFKPTTLKDIANALDVSTSTVSRALRNSHEISVETKQKVIEYANSINYQSNPSALSLKAKRSYAIGVVIEDVANSFFSQAINGIESVAYDNNYFVNITQSHGSYEREKTNVTHLAHRSIDGLLISVSSQTNDYSHLSLLHKQGLPIVFFDRIIENIETFKVVTNNFKAAYDATEAIIKQGYTKIAHLANSPQLSITTERINGYKAALKNNDINFRKNWIIYCREGGKNKQEVKQAFEYLFSGEIKPDSILVASDRISISSLRVMQENPNLSNIKIIGFSNSDVIDLIHPKISYVRQKAFEMGQIATSMLIKLIESKYPIHQFDTKILEAELFI